MHSIIIPHRDMLPTLAWTLWSIRQAAKASRITDYEVIVVDACSASPVLVGVDDPHVNVVLCTEPMPVFNKPVLLNRGIDSAQGDVLTFLDADMLVGRKFLRGVGALAACPAIIRLCYRVRQLSKPRWKELAEADNRDKQTRWLFRRYNHFDQRYEAYGTHHHNAPPENDAERCRVFGNSQFSIRREHLIRPDERFTGYGTEDLAWMQSYEKQYGDAYYGHLDGRGDYSLFHIPHEHGWHVLHLPCSCGGAIVGRRGDVKKETLVYQPG